jgi:hypothetical protein
MVLPQFPMLGVATRHGELGQKFCFRFSVSTGRLVREWRNGIICFVAKPTIYIETTVISYFTSRPSRDVVIAGHQAVTAEWWERDLPKFLPVISSVVRDEISAGDSLAAARRLAVVAKWNVLKLNDEATLLAIEYFDETALPEAARADAMHMAMAAWNGIDYLVTWNCRHIASARVRQLVEKINERRGLATPVICTPEELLEF